MLGMYTIVFKAKGSVLYIAIGKCGEGIDRILWRHAVAS